MRSLAEYRNAIDVVDAEIVDALNRRIKLTNEVKVLKAELGLPAKDEAREREIIARALSVSEPAERDTIFGVYEKIFGGSRGVIETVARGVCILNGRVLLCKAKGAKPTYLPGGHIEFGELGAEALVREVKEETGFEAKAGKLLGTLENSFLQHGKRHCEINLIYTFELLSDGRDVNALTAQEDWIEFVWWPVEKIDEAELLPKEMVRYIQCCI